MSELGLGRVKTPFREVDKNGISEVSPRADIRSALWNASNVPRTEVEIV